MPRDSGPRARFEPRTIKTIWASVVHHLTPPSHPSTTSQSAADDSFNGTGLFYPDSLNGNHASRRTDAVPDDVLHPNPPSKYLKRNKKGSNSRGRGGLSGTTGGARGAGKKSSGAASNSRFGDDEDPNKEYEPVSHTVVDNSFDQFVPTTAKSDSGSTNRMSGGVGRQDSQVMSATTKDEVATGLGGGTQTEKGYERSEGPSVMDRTRRWVYAIPGVEFTVDTAWPSVKHFFDSSFPEPAKERSFQKEAWFSQKQGALMCSAYFLISWALTVGLLPLPLTKFNWWAYFGLAGLLVMPLPVLVMFDFPRRRHWFYQPWLLGAAWIMSDILIGEMYDCQFFGGANSTCGTRNFLNFLGFAYGMPTLAILALRQSRGMAALGAVQWLVVVGVLLVHQGHAPKLFYRNMVNFALYHAFLIATSFLRERSDRQLFALRQQLKIQFRATQSAQVMERHASESKKRFVSYIFHEVRVPLNTALLAVQNLEGENVFKGLPGDQSEMVHGLMGSLTMMEKVLNDVLSFNRMESGKFAQAKKPFEFHKSIQLVALSHRMQAQMAGIDLIVDLDKDIDKIGGVFVGDEMRLRQVASNLVSNSIKFTDTGSVRIVTKLLYPRTEPTPNTEIDDPLVQAAINLEIAQKMEEANKLVREEGGDAEKGSIQAEAVRYSRDSANTARIHSLVGATLGEKIKEKEEADKRKRKAVVRVEIHDTGVGLRKEDLLENRLFSPYVQTEIGRRQGGKGSGLGLALVRQIVKLSNGRLGVESEYGKGSMFWFELPYSLPPPPRTGSRSRESTRELGALRPLSSMSTVNSSPVMGGRSTASMGLQVPRPATPSLGMIEEVSTHSHSPSPLSPDPRSTAPIGFLGEVGLKGEREGEGQGERRKSVEWKRPEIQMTDSTRPLLPEAHGRRRRSSSGLHEDSVTSTFPPVETSSDRSDFGSSPLTAGDRDPFSMGNLTGIERRSSEVEPSTPGEGQSTPTSVLAGGMISQAEQASRGTPRPPVPDSPLCTLVVDDDKLTRMLMSRMLTRLGHQVTSAENGKVALEMIRDSYQRKDNTPAYDVVFLDNQMPLMTGVEVAREVREMGNPLYIVGCTGNALREDQDEYLAAGADEILPKPIHQSAVQEMIKNARRRVAGETMPREYHDRD